MFLWRNLTPEAIAAAAAALTRQKPEEQAHPVPSRGSRAVDSQLLHNSPAPSRKD